MCWMTHVDAVDLCNGSDHIADGFKTTEWVHLCELFLYLYRSTLFGPPLVTLVCLVPLGSFIVCLTTLCNLKYACAVCIPYLSKVAVLFWLDYFLYFCFWQFQSYFLFFCCAFIIRSLLSTTKWGWVGWRRGEEGISTDMESNCMSVMGDWYIHK